MQSIKFVRAGLIAGAAISIAAGSLQAQTYQAIGSTTAAGPQFWNNPSQDQLAAGECNVGSILTNAALTPASCGSESPANLLPLAVNPVPNTYLSNGANGARAFQFGAGMWQFQLLGTVTGSDPVRPWAIYDAGTNTSVGTITTAGGTLNLYSATGFYLVLNAFAPIGSEYYSNSLNAGRSQFAVFTDNGANGSASGTAILGGSLGRKYYVGMEDNACLPAEASTPYACPNGYGAFGGLASDYDYNDMIISAQVVPEPSTYMLMAAGLAGLGFVARRRRHTR